MDNDEIAFLKNEIVRLNKIISVLLSHNDILNEKIAIAERNNASPNNNIAIAKNNEGNNVNEIAFVERRDAHSINGNAFDENNKGNLSLENAFVESNDGNLDVGKGFAENNQGNLKITGTIAGSNTASLQHSNKLAAPMPLTETNVVKLVQILRAEGFKKVRSDAIYNAARLILHFYNNGAGDAAMLRKLTNLSKDGLAKYIGSLKRRNLIQRSGWQQFAPTGYAVSLMQKAGCGA